MYAEFHVQECDENVLKYRKLLRWSEDKQRFFLHIAPL
jgi:hypothetical protein